MVRQGTVVRTKQKIDPNLVSHISSMIYFKLTFWGALQKCGTFRHDFVFCCTTYVITEKKNINTPAPHYQNEFTTGIALFRTTVQGTRGDRATVSVIDHF